MKKTKLILILMTLALSLTVLVSCSGGGTSSSSSSSSSSTSSSQPNQASSSSSSSSSSSQEPSSSSSQDPSSSSSQDPSSSSDGSSNSSSPPIATLYQLDYTSANELFGTVFAVSSLGEPIQSGDTIMPGETVYLSAIANEGYDFDGWYDGENLLSEEASFEFIMPNTSASLEARWSVQKRFVYFYDGYERIETIEVDYNSPAPLFTPTKAYNKFINWFTTPLLEEVFNFETPITKNTSLYAKWESTIVTYSVTFFTEDREQLGGVQTITENQAISQFPAPPSKQGHSFEAWVYYDEQNKPVEINGSTPITCDLEIFPTYAKNSYDVNFYLNGEKLEENLYLSSSVLYNDKIAKPLTPTDEENLFVAWVYLDNPTIEFDFSIAITESVDLLATWTKKPAVVFTVNFYSNTTLVDSQLVEEGQSASAPTSPTKTGYEFIGWDKDFSSITESIDVYAQFEILTFEVVFKNYDGEILKDKQTVDYGSSAIAPSSPEREGYLFVGWDKDFSSVTDNLTVTATYEALSFTASFYNGSDLLTTKTALYGEKFEIPQTPSLAGFSFIGWFADSTLSTPFNFNEAVTGNATIYAKFEKIEIITFSVKFVQPDGEIISEQTVAKGNNAIEPGQPSKEGYIFLGWSGSFYNVTENLVITATYEQKSYSVYFYDYYGELITTKSVKHGENANDVAPSLLEIGEVANMEFSRWNKNLDSITQDTHVFAIFVYETRMVSFLVDGNSYNTQNVEYGSFANIPNTPSKAGSIFKYWYVGDNENEIFDFSTAITEDLELNAKFEQIVGTYLVTFYAPNGSQYGNVQVVAENGYAIEPAPFEDGSSNTYIWCLESSNEAFDFENEQITSNLSLYAKIQ